MNTGAGSDQELERYLEQDRQRLAATQLQDARILGKVNRVHREAFAEKYPSQVEHCLRLVMERLQLGLDKRDGVNPAVPTTWRLTAGDLADLAQAAHSLDQIQKGLQGQTR